MSDYHNFKLTKDGSLIINKLSIIVSQTEPFSKWHYSDISEVFNIVDSFFLSKRSKFCVVRIIRFRLNCASLW